MTFRHVAALALLGWALIFPPMLGDQVDIGAPLNEWEIMGKGFATVHDCEEFRAHGQIITGYANLTSRKMSSRKGVEVWPQRRAASRCTPDVDPRLKGKDKIPYAAVNPGTLTKKPKNK